MIIFFPILSNYYLMHRKLLGDAHLFSSVVTVCVRPEMRRKKDSSIAFLSSTPSNIYLKRIVNDGIR